MARVNIFLSDQLLEHKRRKMLEASRKMDALAKKLGNWDPQATIRKFRDSNLIGRKGP
jgi:hypothetical protein